MKRGSNHYKLGTLFWSRDESIYFTLKRSKDSPRGSLGQFRVNASTGYWSIRFDDKLEEVDIAHSTIHATGQSHVKLRDGSYRESPNGFPLKGLSQPRALWTIVWNASSKSTKNYQPKSTDFVIEEPNRIEARVLYLIAVPLGSVTLNLQTEVNDDGTLPDLALFPFELNGVGLVALLHSTDRMLSPKRTLKINSINNAIPVVTSIDSEKVEGTLTAIKA